MKTFFGIMTVGFITFATVHAIAANCSSTLYSNGTTYVCRSLENGKAGTACIKSGFHKTVKAQGFDISEKASDDLIDMFLDDRSYDNGYASVTSNSLEGRYRKSADMWDGRTVKAEAEFNFNVGRGSFKRVTKSRGLPDKVRSLTFSECKRIK